MGGTISDSKEDRSGAVPPEASGPPPRSLTLMGDRYAVEREIGHGGMGRVFAARDLKLGREVAIKLLPPGAHSDEQLRRFEQEARAAGSLDHPNVLVIHDIGVLEGEPYIVSELLQGATLRKRLGGKELSPAKAVDWALQLAQGLRAAHDKGIVHRDLKPENLFVTNEGRLKILDFGIAKLAAPSAQSGTREGAILGTVGYMAPEQVRGQRADQRSDIFACGGILYEMLAGRRPFEGSSDLETASAILNQEPSPLPRHVPPELDRIVRRCLEKDPADRFQSTADLALALGTTPSLAKGRLGLRRPRQYGIAAAVIALAIGVVTVLTLTRNRRPDGSKHAQSLAVLPLENLSGQPDQEYFADGLTDALITDLSQIRSLRVVSSTSAMRYKKARPPLREIASALNADLIVEGSVVRDHDQVRVTARLIDGATDRHLWTRSYERSVRDVLNLQGEMARTIAREIRVTLTPQEEARLAVARSVSPEAHEAYLMGRYAFNKRTEAGLKQALQYYRRAIDLDPGYAPAHAALASTYNVMQFYAGFSPTIAFPLAREAAQKALQLDDSLAEAHAALARVAAYYDWEWANADREFKRAIDLQPNDPDVYHSYSRYLAATGRVDEALENVRHAQQLDPAPLIFKANEAITLYFARQYGLAIEQLQKVAELDPNFYVAYWGLGLCLEQRGDASGAIVQFEKALALKQESNPNVLASLGHAYALADRRSDALRVLERLAALATTRYVPSYYAATVQIGLGEPGKAIALLEKSYAERSTLLGYLKMDPRFDPLRRESAFQALLSRIGL